MRSLPVLPAAFARCPSSVALCVMTAYGSGYTTTPSVAITDSGSGTGSGATAHVGASATVGPMTMDAANFYAAGTQGDLLDVNCAQ